jgi:hypothetical protein
VLTGSNRRHSPCKREAQRLKDFSRKSEYGEQIIEGVKGCRKLRKLTRFEKLRALIE